MKDKSKRDVYGKLVKLLSHKQTDRGMRLIDFETRCIREKEIHELVTTDQRELKMSDKVDSVGFLGFIEMEKGGVIEKGDEVWSNDKLIGCVLGFDECHFPNHYNIIIAVDKVVCGEDINLCLEQEFCFIQSNK